MLGAEREPTERGRCGVLPGWWRQKAVGISYPHLVEVAVWLASPPGRRYPQDKGEKRQQHMRTAEKR